MDKETIAKILAYVEKNCTEVEEVEEYLWRLLNELKERKVKERQSVKLKTLVIDTSWSEENENEDE